MLDRLFASIDEGLVAVDHDLRYVYVNDSAVRMIGIPREAVIGRTPQEVLPADVVDQVWPHVRRAMETRQPVTYDAYVAHLDRWFENRLYPSNEGATLLFVDVTERRRATEALRRREEMQALLVNLLERSRPLRDPEEVMWTLVQGVGTHLRVERCLFAEVDAAQQTVLVGRDYVDGVPSIAGRHRLDAFGSPMTAELGAGQTFVLHDAATDPRTAETSVRASFDAIGAQALIVVPLVKDDRLVALLAVQQSTARQWTSDEVALLERVAEQTWFAVASARAEAALRESRDVLALAMRGGRMGAWSRNLETNDVWWSPELENIFGLAAGTFGGNETGFFEVVHEDDRERLQHAVATAVQTGTDYRLEFRFRHADGSWRWMDGRGRAVYDDRGTPLWLYGIGIDITERKTAEAALEVARAGADASAQRLQLAMAAARLGDWHWDALTDVVTLSPRAREILGLPADQPLTWTEMSQRVLLPGDGARARAAVTEALATHGDYAMEYRLTKGERWVSARGRGVYDADDRVLGMLGVLQDVSHDRLLLRLDDEVRHLLEPESIAGTAATILGQHLGVERCAAATVDEDGATMTILVDYVRDVPSLRGQYRLDHFGAEVARMLASGFTVAVDDVDASRAISDTERRTYAAIGVRAIACAPILKGGRLQGAIAVHATTPRHWLSEDIGLLQQVASRCWESVERARVEQDRAALLARERNARQQAEMQNQRLAQLSEAAESSSRAKDEFMAMLGHELRNPLAPILTALQLMKLRGDVGSERERTVIERQVNHLTRLVDDLLDVSRIARGKVALKPAPVETSEVVARAIEMASPLLEQRAHTLHVEVPRGDLPMLVDAERLSQVVANLLTNAAKYTPPGGRITVEAEGDGEEVVLRVVDTGIGMAAELVPNVFDLFVQGRQAIDRQEGGLGLGLTIVRNLVERHGGTVEARSDGPGLGSTFTVRVPRAASVGPREVAALRPATVDAAGSAAGRSRVLIVDDNEDAAEMLAHVLAAQGHEIRVAHDGVEALQTCQQFTPEAAFLDLGLPVMDGYELAARLRAMPGLEGMRLIAVTGYGQESDRRRTRAAGFHHHLVKPVDVSAVEALLV